MCIYQVLSKRDHLKAGFIVIKVNLGDMINWVFIMGSISLETAINFSGSSYIIPLFKIPVQVVEPNPFARFPSIRPPVVPLVLLLLVPTCYTAWRPF